ncbi:MAG: nuclease domain-containing protein [Polyangiales bacterium]
MTPLASARWSPAPDRAVTLSLAPSTAGPVVDLDPSLRGSRLVDEDPSRRLRALRWAPLPRIGAVPPLSVDARGEYVVACQGLRPEGDVGGALSPIAGAGGRVHALRFEGRAGLAALRFVDDAGARFDLELYVRASHLDEPEDLAAMVDDLAAVAPSTALTERSSTRLWVRADALRPVDRAPRGWAVDAALRDGALAAALERVAERPITGIVRGAHGVTEGLDVRENRVARRAFDELFDLAPSGEGATARRDALLALLSRCPPLATVRASRTSRDGVALRRREGYRELLAIRDACLGGVRVDVAGEGTAPVYDAASLYERWCAVALCDALDVGERAASLLEGAAVTARVEGRAVALRYQPAGESWGLGFRPDLTVEHRDRALVLDAKFRRDPETGRAPRDEIVAMHAYRDALRGAWGAWAIYPGDASEAWRSPDGGGVGALALRPSASRDRVARVAALRSLVAAFVDATSPAP